MTTVGGCERQLYGHRCRRRKYGEGQVRELPEHRCCCQLVAIKGGTKNAVYTYPSPATADGYGSGTANPLTVDINPGKRQDRAACARRRGGTPFSVSYHDVLLHAADPGFLL